MYAGGQGVSRDYAEAVKWFRLAAQQGNVEAQYDLGVMYTQGQGVPQDYAQSVKWFRLAAQQGFAKAQFNLGAMYNNGTGVSKDYVRAHLWFDISAASGNTDANKILDLLAGRMTPAQIEKAQKIARDCMANKLKGCN